MAGNLHEGEVDLGRRRVVEGLIAGGVIVASGGLVYYLADKLLNPSKAKAAPPPKQIYLPFIARDFDGEIPPTPTPTPETPIPPERPFPGLQVEGPYITFMKEQEKINAEFKGASVYTFLNGSYKFNEKTKYYIDLARQWGSNCIRFMLDFGKINLDELKKAVDYLSSQRIFCLLCPNSLNEVALRNPIYQEGEFNQLLNFTDALVRKFQDKTNVMYQLLGEPGPVEVAPGDWRWVTWAEWAPWARNLATAIRNVRSDVLIGLPGVNGGRNFEGFKDHPESFPFNNYFATVHFYRIFAEDGTEITPDPAEWSWLIKQVPILFPEMGVPDCMGGRNHWADDDAINYILNLVEANPYKLHVSAFEMAPFDWRTSLVKDANGTPSSRGQPYHDNYLNPNSTCPQTQFP